MLLVNENWVMEVKCASVISGDRHLVSLGPEIDLSLITQLGCLLKAEITVATLQTLTIPRK